MKIVERKRYRCPYCGTVVSHINSSEVSPMIGIRDGMSAIIVGVRCPICGTPIALDSDRTE